MPAEPALRLATDYVRIALADFTMSWAPRVEDELVRQGFTLTDLANALRSCRVMWSDKLEASNTIFEVMGETTEGDTLILMIRIEPNVRKFIVEEVF